MDKTSKRDWVRNINLTLSDDFMEASVKIRKGADVVMPTLEEFKEYVKSYGINFGVIETALRDAIAPKDAVTVENIVIARGVKAVFPEAGRIDYLIPFDEHGRPKKNADGSVDLKDLSLVIPVQAGAPLARKIPGKFGKGGRNIKGDPLIVPEVKPANLPVGINTRIAETDPNLLVAAKTGNVVKVGEYINVYEEHVIGGDVDFSTGNFSFMGSVRIKGSIRTGFSVKTGGNLFVEGDVEDATIECGGNLVVKGGIIGKMKTVIRAAGNVEARYVNGHHIKAMGNILIQDEAMNAKLESGSDIYLWKKGVMSGGEAYVFNRLDAKVLGSESGNYTDVYFGYDMLLANRITEIKNEREEVSEKCRGFRRSVYTTLKNALLQAREPLGAELKEVALAKKDLGAYYETLEKLEQEEETLSAKRKKGSSPMVTVREGIFQGVTLASSTTTTHIREKRRLCGTYIVIGADIVLSKLID